MKKMTCEQLGGACSIVFEAESFDEIAKLSQAHGREMFEKGDEAHMKAMKNMNELMQYPESMNKWMEEKRKEFEALPIV
jgi:hypothetical protein